VVLNLGQVVALMMKVARIRRSKIRERRRRASRAR
jgi:hypothetical protein